MADAPSQTLLDPKFLARLEQLELVSRKIFLGRMKGERRSKKKGQSVEFADYSNYVVGDDLRFLDWNLYARLDKLFLRLFMEEEDLHFYILIDNSLSMDFGSPTKLHYAKQVAAALGFIGLVNLDRVVIEAFNDRLTQIVPAVRGRRSFWRLLDFLDKLEPAGPSDLTQALRTFSIKSSGKGIVVVLSDFMDKGGYEDALRYLIARQMDIYVDPDSVPGRDRAGHHRRPETGRRGGRRRGRDHRQAPAAEALQAEPRRLPGCPARLLHAPGRGVPVHQQSGAVRPAGADVPAATRVWYDKKIEPQRHRDTEKNKNCFRDRPIFRPMVFVFSVPLW